MSSEYIRYPDNTGGGSISIGSTITGGTQGSVLFIGPASTLAQDNANFNFNDATHALTITGLFSSSNFSGSSTGTNTGDVTLAAFGSTPNANGLSLSGQVLNLQPADSTHSGGLSSTDWNTFNNKAPAFGSQSQNLFFASPNGSSGTPSFRSIVAADLPSLSGTYVLQSEVGAANGVASLDGAGKVPVGQLPSAVMQYEGAWNPNTNSPALSDGTGTNGNVYYVTALRAAAVSGLTDPSMVNFQIGDLVIYSSSVGKWQLVTPAAGVQSVNGLQGVVVVNAINQLTGDVAAGPASGSASAASTIQPNVVSNTKLAQMPTLTIKGNNTGGTTNALDLTVSQVNVMLGSLVNPMTTLGDIVYENATPAPARLAGNTTAVKNFLTQTGTGSVSAAPAWGTIAVGDVPTLNQNTSGSAGSVSGTNVVTNTNLSQMPTHTIKGNNTGGTANALDLTVAQVNAILPVFTSSLNGLVPASGGGTTNFLRADGSFAPVSSGSINYILNPGAEVNTSGWSTYANAAANIPSNGTGNTPSPVTIATFAISHNNDLGSSTSSEWRGQSFTATVTAQITTNDVHFAIANGTGLTGNIVAKLYSDSGGNPGTVLATSSNTVNSAVLTTSYALFTFTFSSGPTLINGGFYHIVYDTSGVTYALGEELLVSCQGVDPYPGGYSEDTANSGASWTPDTTYDVVGAIGGLTSGTPAITFARSTSSPLIGVASFLVTQPNSTNVQGNGVSYDFTIDTAYQNQFLSISLNYNASSTFQASDGVTTPNNDGSTGFNSGNSDVEIFIYDITNAALIPVTPEVMLGNGANNFIYSGSFKAASNSISYRLIFHCATSNANATGWAYKFDNVAVSPASTVTVSGFQFFASSQITSLSSSNTSGSFATFSNSPAFTLPATVTGKYKVYCGIPIFIDAASTKAVLRVVATSGSPTLLYESQSTADIASVMTAGNPVQSVYSLTAGMTYVFDLQGKIVSGSGGVYLDGADAPFYMFAELCG